MDRARQIEIGARALAEHRFKGWRPSPEARERARASSEADSEYVEDLVKDNERRLKQMASEAAGEVAIVLNAIAATKD